MQKADLLRRARQPLRRPGDRQGLDLRPEGEGRPRRHRQGRDRQGAPSRGRRSSPTAAWRSRRMIEALRGVAARSTGARLAPWIATLRRLAGASTPTPTTAPSPTTPGSLTGRAQARRRSSPSSCIERLRAADARGHDPRLGRRPAPDVGLAVLAFEHPNTWINSGGLGTMGFAVPAAIGAKVGRPDRMVWAVDGDGCFQMTAQELVTATRRAHPGQDRHLEQRLSRHGPPVAAHVLRGALLGGLPLAGPARLRRMGRGDGLRRPSGREPRGGHARHREGERRSTTGPS